MAQEQLENPESDFSDDVALSPLDKCFNEVAGHVRTITSKLDNDQLLQLYGLYKQSTEGTCNTQKPGWFDGKGRKKWQAWSDLGDMPSELAKEKYIELVAKHKPDADLSGYSKPKYSWVTVSTLAFSPEPELDNNKLSLLEAARENCAVRVTELLKKNSDLRFEKDEDGLSALHWAADRDATEALEAAIKGGCPLNAVDECGQTALHYAAACGNVNSAKILVNSGALMLKDFEDNTPLDLASDDEVRKVLTCAT